MGGLKGRELAQPPMRQLGFQTPLCHRREV